MAGEDNAAIVRAFYQRIDRQDWDGALRLFTDDFRVHMGSGPQTMSGQEFAGFGQSFFAAMPDLTHTVEALAVDGDTVAARLTVSGTHQHELMGMPGTGRAVEFSSMNFFQLRGGKIAEQWGVFDIMALLQQIGAMPVPA